LTEPICGDLGAPMRRNTYGLRPERRYCAGAWAAYSFVVTPCCRMFKRLFVCLPFCFASSWARMRSSAPSIGRVRLKDQKQVPGEQGQVKCQR
jgi:hypothetical protein